MVLPSEPGSNPTNDSPNFILRVVELKLCPLQLRQTIEPVRCWRAAMSDHRDGLARASRDSNFEIDVSAEMLSRDDNQSVASQNFLDVEAGELSCGQLDSTAETRGA